VLWHGENLEGGLGINRAYKNTKQDIKTFAKDSICHYKLKQHKPWFDEEYKINRWTKAGYTAMVAETKQNEDNMKNARREVRRTLEFLRKTKLMNSKQTVRAKISETCAEE
jgi:predicted metallo-beta-lactamase superfamily hydrolase